MKQLKTTPPPNQKRGLQYMYDVTSHWFQYQVRGVFIKYICHITVHSTCRQTVEPMKKKAPMQKETSPFQLRIHPSVPRNDRNY